VKKLPLNWRWVLGCAALCLSASGCGSSQPDDGQGPKGSVGLTLQISPGVTVTSGTYVISGPNGFSSGGQVPIGDSADVPVVVNGVPVANGYQMDVVAEASDGDTMCEGTATFDVQSTAQTTVVVHLVCGVPTGNVDLNGTVNVCPVADGLSASPANAVVGGTLALSALAHDPDTGPSALAYRWSANGQVLAGKTAPTLNFTCTSPGTLVIAVRVSDGDTALGCSDNLTVNATCTAP
jgi:hypothetical protein